MKSPKISLNRSCPCHSGRKYKQCCRPWHQGRPAPTPEALMRSRYAAYSLHNVEYIMQTYHPESPLIEAGQASRYLSIRQFCQQTEFVGLEILEIQLDEP